MQSYALTRRTQGIDRASLKVGQRMDCTITARLAVVLSAANTVSLRLR